jgi:transcriptional regulator with XRE-family HTH domain
MRKTKNSQNKWQQDTLAHLLRDLRRQAGLRQIELAARLGLPQSFISKYESGERSLDLFELRKICAALDIPFLTLFNLLEEGLKEHEG